MKKLFCSTVGTVVVAAFLIVAPPMYARGGHGGGHGGHRGGGHGGKHAAAGHVKGGHGAFRVRGGRGRHIDGVEPVIFPGDHGGFAANEWSPDNDPAAFAAKLREVLVED